MQKRDEAAWRQFSRAYSGSAAYRIVRLWLSLMEIELEKGLRFDEFAVRTYRQTLLQLRLHDQNAQALGPLIHEIEAFWEYGPELLAWYQIWSS